MRILIINEVLGWSSTGKIAGDLAKEYEAKGWEAKVAYGRSGYVPEEYRKFGVRIGNDLDVKINALKARVFDNEGLNAKGATKKFLQWAEEYNPDLVWLHNLHGYYINYEMLFTWIKSRPQMEIKWTLHDCWAFTGHCTHFSFVKCVQWKSRGGCLKCSQIKQYPKSFLVDHCHQNYHKKKSSFSGVKDLTIITPSNWLGDIVKQSLLSEYKVEVVHNSINLTIFKPTNSDFRERYKLQNKKIILCVANVWNERKGLTDALKLGHILDSNSVMIIVGLTITQIKQICEKCSDTVPEILGDTEKSSIFESSSNTRGKKIYLFSKTTSPRELSEIYTAADLFFNPTYEDTYPTVNLEAEACGTRVVTYDAGGAKETLHNKDSVVIPIGDFQAVLKYI